MKKIVVFDGVSFKYDDSEVEVLHSVDLDIDAGTFVAIIGRNGSGKSTFSKHINALYVPSEGSVFTAGLSTSEEENWLSIRQKAGMVFQNPDNQMVTSIVEDDVAFGPENLGVEASEIRQRVDDALSLVGMKAFAKAAPHYLSGGQKQRIAIAGILAMEPDILILDESTAMLDPQGRSEIMETVLRLREERGICVIWITHFMDEAMQADRIIVMDQGKIQMQGTPEEIFSKQNINQLETFGLELPFNIELACHLQEAGLPIDLTLSEEVLVKELCQYLLKT